MSAGDSSELIITRIISSIGRTAAAAALSCADPAQLPLRKLVISLAFYPTLGWNRIKTNCRCCNWFEVIDVDAAGGGSLLQVRRRIRATPSHSLPGELAPSTAIVEAAALREVSVRPVCSMKGAFPLEFVARRLFADHRVKTVLNLCDEKAGPTSLYGAHGVTEHWLRTVDFECPSQDHLDAAVEALAAAYRAGHACYVHCKAGKGRSTCCTVAFLTRCRGLTPLEAQRLVRAKRPQVSWVIQRPLMLEFFQRSCLATAVAARHGEP